LSSCLTREFEPEFLTTNRGFYLSIPLFERVSSIRSSFRKAAFLVRLGAPYQQLLIEHRSTVQRSIPAVANRAPVDRSAMANAINLTPSSTRAEFQPPFQVYCQSTVTVHTFINHKTKFGSKKKCPQAKSHLVGIYLQDEKGRSIGRIQDEQSFQHKWSADEREGVWW
jgi:hypothetical protein